LIDDNLRLKLGDFGLATFNNAEFAKKKSVCGTPNYIAPEII
jgi:serine/threonine protein kinase